MKDKIIEYYKTKPVPLKTEDVIQSKCWILPTYQTKTPEQKMVQLMNSIYLKDFYFKYVTKSKIGDSFNIEEAISVNDIELQAGLVSVDNVWLHTIGLSYQEWGNIITKDSTNEYVLMKGERLALILCDAAINAYIRGHRLDNILLMFYNQNNQYYRIFSVEGDLTEFLKEAQFRLANATEPNNTVGADVCMFCAHKDNCKKTEVIHPSSGIIKDDTCFDGLTIIEETSIAESVHEYLDSLNYKRSESHDDGWFHPSEMAITPCDRRLYYAVTKAEKVGKIIPYLRTIFDVGHAVHEVLQEAMTSVGVPIEVLAEDVEAKIHGRTDGAGENFIVEIKSAAHSSFKSYEKKGPSEAHIMQTAVYSTLLEKEEVRFQYFNKNDGQIMECVVPHNLAEYAFLKGRAQTILAHVDANTPPPQLEKYGKDCKDCPYEHICRV